LIALHPKPIKHPAAATHGGVRPVTVKPWWIAHKEYSSSGERSASSKTVDHASLRLIKVYEKNRKRNMDRLSHAKALQRAVKRMIGERCKEKNAGCASCQLEILEAYLWWFIFIDE
jgi:transposase-like protein